jgi:glycosyltransferase involved in cell wall biosynthesis
MEAGTPRARLLGESPWNSGNARPDQGLVTDDASDAAGAQPQRRALIVGYLTYRGDARVKNQVRVLTANGYAVDLICLAEDSGDRIGSANLIGIKVPHYRGSKASRYIRSYANFFLRAMVKATKLAARHRYDVAIACNMPDSLVLCLLAPKFRGARIVLDVHDPLPELYGVKFGRQPGGAGERALMFEERISGWFADRVLATHELHARRLESAGTPASKQRIVISAPNSLLFRYGTESLNRSGKFRLVYHGTLAPRLGIEIAIHAVGLLRDAIPEIELLLIGRGDALEACRRLTRELGLESRVHFESPVAVETLPQRLRGCAIGVVPNRKNAATEIMLPVKLIEYAMLGIPIVAARLGPITQYFDSDSIEYFEPDNAEDMARALSRLYREPERCASIAAKANRTARELCANWDENYLKAIS